jgi:CO dehydrogenase maturation factor
MKIAISGKGGTGKTFIAGCLATGFTRRGYPVIAIDADPSPNLAQSLGLSLSESARIVPVAQNEELIRLKTGTEHPGVFRMSFTVEDIIKNYCVQTPSGASLMVMGTVTSMGGGCTCPAHSVLKALFRHLVVEREEFVLLDMEAGIEHLGRGTAEHVDTLLVVTDADLKSLEIARTICRLASGSSIRNVGLVGNRVLNKRQERAILIFAQKHKIPVLALIPYDPDVVNTGMTGEPLDKEKSRAYLAVLQLASTLTGTGTGQDMPEVKKGDRT